MGYLDERAGLAGKTAVVVGAGEGLGRGSALALAHCGVDLALCDRDEGALAHTHRDAEDLGVRVLSQGFDARDDDALKTFFEEFDSRFDRLDILVNVVGGALMRSFLESGPDDWERDIDWNYRYLVRSTHEAARRMREKGGSIVNITTIEAHRAAPGVSVYAGAKAAVENFTRSIAVELAPYGIRANTIAPDKTPTPGVLRSGMYLPPIKRHDPEEVSRLRYQIAIPMGRPGSLDDIAYCVLFLASDLSAYLTGQALHPDGGAWASAGWLNWPGLGFRTHAPTPVVEAILDVPEDFVVPDDFDPDVAAEHPDPTWLVTPS